VTTARRETLVRGTDLKTALVRQAGASLREGDFDTRLRIALRLKKSGMTQRAINETTGVARDTLRKYLESGTQESNEV
jgi:predicted transcriptional regulator